jgi:hypothetical protein
MVLRGDGMVDSGEGITAAANTINVGAVDENGMTPEGRQPGRLKI